MEETEMPQAAVASNLADFQQQLIGRWTNQNFGTDSHGNPVGGQQNPLSYNIMPLPETADPDGYILKNFKYYEMLNFNDTIAVAAEAPNRGGLVSQNCRALFYEQQVLFAEGPKINNIVHVENGLWLWLPIFVQQLGPYPANIDQEAVLDSLNQPADVTIAKQISIPHGNAILALGSFDTVPHAGGTGVCRTNPMISGSPVIPDAPFPYPVPAIAVTNSLPPPSLKSNLNVDERYTTVRNTMADYENPHPDLTQCPNKPIQRAVEIIKPDAFMHWRVTAKPLQHGTGIVTNIPFEQRVSNVTVYFADYWMLFKTVAGTRTKYLAYTQTILMNIRVKGEIYSFPHVTCNTLTAA
jgi:hypothetical protein